MLSKLKQLFTGREITALRKENEALRTEVEVLRKIKKAASWAMHYNGSARAQGYEQFAKEHRAWSEGEYK